MMDASRLRLLIALFEAVRHNKNVLEKSKGQMFVHILRFSDDQGIVGVRARQLMDALAESLHGGHVENMCRQLGEGLLASLLQVNLHVYFAHTKTHSVAKFDYPRNPAS